MCVDRPVLLVLPPSELFFLGDLCFHWHAVHTDFFFLWELKNQSLGLSRFLSRGFPRQGPPGLVEEGGGGARIVAKAIDFVVGQVIAAARLTQQIRGALDTESKVSQERDACIHMEATSPGFRPGRTPTILLSTAVSTTTRDSSTSY